MITSKSITSIARRFVELGKFRPRFKSLKRINYCRRHVFKNLEDGPDYLELIDNFSQFLRCTYQSESDEVIVEIEEMIAGLNEIKNQIEKVRSEELVSVQSSNIHRVTSSATRLRHLLRGTNNTKDCRKEWLDFGLVYHSLF